MIIKEVGFRPVYHYVCAFELNDVLREVIRACPGADKASHAVVYGYIDPKEGMMLEVLCAGKQAPKYFYFRDPYEGKRITLHASEVDDIEFMYFPDLENRFYKKFVPRINELKQYDAPADVEEIRKDESIDICRNNQYPDDAEVLFIKKGLKKERLWVRLIGSDANQFSGKLLNQPVQDFGLNKGDIVTFKVREKKENLFECYKDFDEKELTREDLEDGSYLKKVIAEFKKNPNEKSFAYMLSVLKSSYVFVPGDMLLSEEAQTLMDKYGPGDDVSDEDRDRICMGMTFLPSGVGDDKNTFLPVFSSRDEASKTSDEFVLVDMPFMNAVNMAANEDEDYAGILVNGYSDQIVIKKDLFDAVRDVKGILPEEKSVFIKPPVTDKTAEAEAIPMQGQNGILIRVGKMDLFNYALYHNDVEPIRGIQIINTTSSPIDDAVMRIYSDEGIFRLYEALLPTLPSNTTVSIADPQIYANGQELASVKDTKNIVITIEIVVDDKVVSSINGKMKVFAYDQWQGGLTYRDLLPAFVLPNHPLIAELQHDVSDNLKQKGKPISLEGYQADDVDRVNDFAKAAFEVIKSKNIVYANPPASFMVPGQRVRTPEVILDQKLGTCMDMTLLYAALLEAIGLHTILVLQQGHIYAGYWKRERSPEEIKHSELVVEDQSLVAKLITGGASEASFVECTLMCSGKDVTFADALAEGEANLLGSPDKFMCAIDVEAARSANIIPMPSRIKTNDGYQIETGSDSKSDSGITDKVDLSGSDLESGTTRKITNKKELWESKLLDLSGRNMLLNLPKTSAVLPIMSSSIGKLEDALSDGEEFGIYPVPQWIEGIRLSKTDKNGKEIESISFIDLIIKEIGILEAVEWPVASGEDIGDKIRQEYRKHRLYSFFSEKNLDNDLTTIYRASRKSQQENGVSSLYIAIGLLRWFDEDSKTPNYAPLILVPVELVRKSANLGYALHMRNEDPHFNSTLLEMLKQKYNLDLSVLNKMPFDEHGVDVNKVFAFVRKAVRPIKDWKVIETCVLGNFSFAQFTMWNDIHSAGDSLENNKLVRSLMKGYVDWEISDPIDETKKVYLPISVDATQLKAIRMASQGKTFVLHGPPGTGKSQTITAMISNLVAEGKKVLFVAEKEAALRVVKDRLRNDVGIGDFCLEIHSDKADKKHVLEELETALNRSSYNYAGGYAEYEKMAQESRSELDTYAERLHEVAPCGYSLRMLIAQYELVRDEKQFVRFNQDAVGLLTYSDINAHIPLIEQLISAGSALGNTDTSLLSGIKLTAFSADVRSKVKIISDHYMNSLEQAEYIGAKAAEIMGSDKPGSLADLHALDSLISLYNDKKGTDALLIDLLNEDSGELVEYLNMKEQYRAEEQRMLNAWHAEFLDMDMSFFLAKHEAAGKKLFGKNGAMSAVTSEIQGYSYEMITYVQIPALLNGVIRFQDNRESFRKMYDGLTDRTKRLLEEIPTIESYNRAHEVALDCQRQAEKFPGGLSAIMDISRNHNNSVVFDELETGIRELERTKQEFDELLIRTTDENREDWFENEKKLCDYLVYHLAVLKDWCIYNRTLQECYNVGLEPVVSAYKNGMDPQDLIGAYKKGLYYALINNIISKDDDLSSFSGSAFNEAIAQFKKKDEELLRRTKTEIARILASRIPVPTESSTVGIEINILRKAISSNARGISLRELFEKIPNILFRLCPCVLMSPNSVAQYLPQDNGMFDVVIFDEASQLPTCKAIGSLLRAKDAVIVGDPKQMPPTSFFAGAGPEVEDFSIADLDSILDDVLALGIPSQHLQWHYRSRHESLIAFSNYSFYKNRMYTFPSANDRERRVKALYVNGTYKKSTNLIEAEEVVAEVVRRYNDPELKKQSVGVVTFNMTQQELIRDLLLKQYQKDPEFEKWANSEKIDIFVKNLENVQGDERDAIIFSICYGPDEKGKISNNFGPINKPGGEKRLNVAFSRARVSMTIITSMHSSDIHADKESPDGVKAFKNFLSFAEGKEIQTDSDAKANAGYSKAGIMQRICKELKLKGYECATLIGHSDFHIDIAVVDPFDPDRYMLGILLDGDSYRQTKNTRDREVAQISVLKGLGWNLCRVWAMDWWDNRDKEIDRLLTLLESLKAEAEERYQKKLEEEARLKEEQENLAQQMEELKSELGEQAEEVVAEEEELESAVEEQMPSVNTKPVGDASDESPMKYVVVDYQKAVADDHVSIEEFSSPGFKKQIAERIRYIISVEAPILRETLMRRVFETYGVSKTVYTTEAFENALKFSKVKGVKLKGTVFFWTDNQDPQSYRTVRVSNERTCDEICLKELSNGLCYVLAEEGPLPVNDLIKKTSVLFGYKRLGKNVESTLMNGLKWAKSSGFVEVSEGLYRVVST